MLGAIVVQRPHTKLNYTTNLHFFCEFFQYVAMCLQCFDAVGWAAGRASGLKKLSGGVLAWLLVWS